MMDWYRQGPKDEIALLSHGCQMTEIEMSDRGVKHMKTKWGSYNIQARRVWLNLELAKKCLITWSTCTSMNPHTSLSGTTMTAFERCSTSICQRGSFAVFG